MSAKKKSAGNSVQENNIRAALLSTRRSIDHAYDVVSELEGKEISEKYRKRFNNNGDLYNVFCVAYVIKLITKYVGSEKAEILFLAYGLLYGYDDIKLLKDRRPQYARDAYGKNTAFSGDPDGLRNNLYNVENDVIDDIARQLAPLVCESDGTAVPLGLAESVYLDLCERYPNGLPQKYPLPVPRFLNDAAAERLGLQTDVVEEPVETPPDDSSPEASDGNATETAATEIGVAPETTDDADSTAASDVSGKEENDGAQPEEATTQSKQIRMNLPKHKAYLLFGTLMLIAVVAAFIVVKAIYPLTANPNGDSVDAQPPVDLEAVEVMVPDKVIEELIIEAQEPIAVFDNAGQYDILAMCHEIKEKIMHNPIYGDMVAQGLIGTGELVTEHNTWLMEFVEATDAAVEDGDGMRRWITYPQGMLMNSDEYTEYANKLCTLLDFYIPVGIYEMESTGNWSLGADSEGALVRARENSEQATSPALMFQYVDAGENVKATFGFCVDDGRFAIYNPALMQNWDELQITERGAQ